MLVQRLLLGVVALVCAAAPSQAQILYGSLVGNVTDATESAIPGAKITITHDATGATRSAETTAAGVYRFPTIQTGLYSIAVQADGFSTAALSGVEVAVNNTTRMDIPLEIGQVTETVEVSASAARLQTDRAEVRAEVTAETLNNVPVPLGRNYQMLLQTIPGFSPPRNAHSAPANPTRSVRFSVNGTNDQTNNVRIDGASSYNPNLTHMTGINPALESIEVVDVVTNSFDAEQGLAGGAAINLQIKSGTNALHGSGFWYHNNQHLQAYPYFSQRDQAKPKFIYNQAGGTIGGPIKKNKAFFFVSYERTSEHSNATRFLKTPTQAMRDGDFSASPLPVFDPMSAATGSESKRTPFANNLIPESRISGPSRRAFDTGDWLLPNAQGTGSLGLANNLFASIPYAFDRDQIDSKVNFNLSEKWTMFARLSYFYYDQNNPGPFGILDGPAVHPTNSRAGFGFGPTYSGTISTTYVAKPNLVFDAYFGSMLLDSNAGSINADQEVGLEILGIPGTNGRTSFEGGAPRMRFDSGFAQLGYSSTSAFFGHDFQHQIAWNGNWTKGNHEVRFGSDTFLTYINQQVANFNGGDSPAGGFRFRSATTSAPGTGTNDYNTMASFVLGLSRDSARNFLNVPQFKTRSRIYSLYLRDRWQIRPNLTMSYGTRWEYYPFPTRDDRGLERFDFQTNEQLVCGVGSIPKDCGVKSSKKLFAPRMGLAWRVTDKTVARAGYGITYDPFNLGRDMRGGYPAQFSFALPFANSRAWSTTLEDGLPAIPDIPEGDRLPMPLTGNVLTVDDNFQRGYVQSWNATIEHRIGSWIGSAGYVATRSVRQTSRKEANWADLGTGNAGRQLRQAYGRTASTLYWGHLGTPKYDALQMRLQRRAAGAQVSVAYTWANTRGYTAENSTATPSVGQPDYLDLNYGPLSQDIRHNLTLSGVFELPFGQGKRYANEGVAAAILGGWQINTLGSLHTGLPTTPGAPATVLNAPPSGNRADCLAPMRTLNDPNGWWDISTLADPNIVDPNTPRFGTCGPGSFRGPGLVNFDLGLFRKFQITERVDLQFRAESFNFTNTPHFNTPSAAVNSGNFGVVTGMQNTGREGIDQRFFRFGLRLAF